MFVEITVANTDVPILTVAERQVLEIKDLMIENASTAAATVVIKDVYTRTGATSSTSRILFKRTVGAGVSVDFRGLKGMKVIGTLYATSDQQPVRITVDVREVEGE